MNELVVVRFHNRRRAAKLVDVLWKMNDALAIELEDAVTVFRDRRGNLEFDESFVPTLEKLVARAGLNGLLIGIIVALPVAILLLAFSEGPSLALEAFLGCLFACGAIGIVTGVSDASLDHAWWRDHRALDGCFVREAGNLLGPDDSAILAWIDPNDLDKVAEQFAYYGGDVRFAYAERSPSP
jgi:uncharacterized membrane protein